MENKQQTDCNVEFCNYSGTIVFDSDRNESFAYIKDTGQQVFDFATSYAKEVYGEVVISKTW